MDLAILPLSSLQYCIHIFPEATTIYTQAYEGIYLDLRISTPRGGGGGTFHDASENINSALA